MTVLTSAAAAAWTVCVGSYAIWRHDQFLSHRYDLGNMVQAVWSTTQGRILEVTDPGSEEQVIRLGSHVDPVLVLFVPFWAVFPTPETLIAVQTAALAAGLYPVVQLARKHIQSTLAVVLLGAWYLVYPWVLWNAVNDVHPVTLAVPLLLWAIWFLDEDRLAPFCVVAVLSLLTGELVGLTVAMLGVWYAARHRRIRTGIAFAVAGVTWTAVCLYVLIPAARGGEPSPFYHRFESVGGSPGGVVRTLVTDPGAIFTAITSGADLEYVAYVLIPTAFLALGTPLLAAAALPQLGVNTLSEFWSTTQPMFQYVAPLIAPLVGATIIAIGRFPTRLVPVAAAAPLAAAVACLCLVPPIPGGQEFVFAPRESSMRLSALREALAWIPPDAAVASTNRLGAHLSGRRRIWLFPETSAAEWVVLDTSDEWLDVGGEDVDRLRFANLLRDFEREPTWERVLDRAGVRVYRRQAEAEASPPPMSRTSRFMPQRVGRPSQAAENR